MGRLVLSRKRDEQVLIGHGIVISVCEIRGDKVRLGVEAPRHVPVDRGEVRPRRNTESLQLCEACGELPASFVVPHVNVHLCDHCVPVPIAIAAA